MERNVFYADRSDGLGQRLWTIANALILSKKLDGDFSIVWPIDKIKMLQDHAVSEPAGLFSDDFRGRFLSKAPDDCISVSDPNFLSSAQSQRRFAFRSEPIFLKTWFPELEVSYRDYQEAIAHIGFSGRAATAIAAAKNFPVGNNTIAVQVRAGDIIYGRYRFDDRFHFKVVPYPLLCHEMGLAREQGREILVFGQDDDLCDNLAEAYGGHRPFYSKEVDLQAIFEIFLLSRCHTIFGGSSGFSQVASCFGGSSLLDPSNGKSPQELLRIYEDHIQFAGASSLQTAFALYSKFHMCRSLLSLGEQAQILLECCRLDPGNDYYKVAAASVLFQDEQFTEAESTLAKCSGKNVHGALWGLMKPTPSGLSRAWRFVKSFQGAAETDCYMANLCLGIGCYFQGRHHDASMHLRRCLSLDPDSRNANTERLKTVLSEGAKRRAV